jgi:hypothetical protein
MKRNDKNLSDGLTSEFWNENLLLEKDFNREEFPLLYNLSSAFIYDHIPVPKVRKDPEFVFLKDYSNFMKNSALSVTIAEWNMIWESGQLRTDFFWQNLPKDLNWLKEYENSNIYLIPDHQYYSYAPLFHLLPFRTRKNFKLPLIKKGNWPFLLDHDRLIVNNVFKINYLSRLSNAFANHIWPILDNQSKIGSFSKNDPIKLLAHNLNYWLPGIYKVIEERLSNFDRIDPKTKDHLHKIDKLQKEYPEIDIKLPLMGGTIWEGEDDAWKATQELINITDQKGNLRNIIDAVKSNRVQDDFSDKWSFAKEDFERKVYSKRQKIKVTFVELDDDYPIHCSTSELDDNLL